MELYAENGYLINPFISQHTNFRSDEYGGSLANRLRFLREIVAAVSAVFGSRRVGVRFAPLFTSTDEERVYLGLVEDDPHAAYTAAAKMLDEMAIGYLSIAETDWDNSPDLLTAAASRASVRSPQRSPGAWTICDRSCARPTVAEEVKWPVSGHFSQELALSTLE